jgi:hypothetical protein
MKSESDYHAHQTFEQRLAEIRVRNDALRVHAGMTDYAHRVVMDCAWLLEQVERLHRFERDIDRNSLEHLAEYEAARSPLGPSDFREVQEVALAQRPHKGLKTCCIHTCTLKPVAKSNYCAEHIRRY